MRRASSAIVVLGLTSLALPGTAYSDPLTEAAQASTLHADIRLRYEGADDSVNPDADALTLRSRVGFTTGQLSGFSLLAEFEDVRTVGGVDDYAPHRPGFAVIADPEVTQVNRAFLRYQGDGGVDLGLGRQRIIYDNARFVGNVGWRQNEQTFDAFTGAIQPLADLTVSYAYLDKIEGITPAFDADVDSHLLNLQYTGLGFGTVTAYGYLLEDDDSNAENDTGGIRFNGSRSVDSVEVLYTAEYAYQDTNAFDASYWLLEAGATVGTVTVKLAHEVLGSDDGAYGFQTPLATKHAFNGWADKFLVTPATGLKDTFATLAATVAGVSLTGVYHWFDADEGAQDYGTELDLQAVKAFGKHYTLGLKYARYSADDFSADTDKVWLWGEFKF
jgi:hypothetical protein